MSSPQTLLLDAIWQALEASSALADCEFLRIDDESLPQDLVDPRKRLRMSIHVYPDGEDVQAYRTSMLWEMRTSFLIVVLNRRDPANVRLNPRPLMDCVYEVWRALAKERDRRFGYDWVERIDIGPGVYGDPRKPNPERWDGDIDWAYTGTISVVWRRSQAEMET